MKHMDPDAKQLIAEARATDDAAAAAAQAPVAGAAAAFEADAKAAESASMSLHMSTRAGSSDYSQKQGRRDWL